MTESDKSAFVGLISDVLAFYRQDVTPFTLSVWWQACDRFSLEQVRKALTSHAMDPDHGKFAPKPADLVRVLGGTRTDRALVAWSKVFDAMQTVGAYSDVCFDDPTIHAVIQDLGGWVKFCRADASDQSYQQHRFCEAYKVYVNRGEFEYPRALTGDRGPDGDYQKRGLPLPKPRLIGDREVAKAIYLGGGYRIENNMAKSLGFAK
jgi:hypothetical protein